jgi:hypothetical protein
MPVITPQHEAWRTIRRNEANEGKERLDNLIREAKQNLKNLIRVRQLFNRATHQVRNG